MASSWPGIVESGDDVDSPRLLGASSRVVTDWNKLRALSSVDEKIPVPLFVLCKTIVDDEDGALYLNGTLVQRILGRGAFPEQLDTFTVSLKGPFSGGELKSRRIIDLPLWDQALGGLGNPGNDCSRAQGASGNATAAGSSTALVGDGQEEDQRALSLNGTFVQRITGSGTSPGRLETFKVSVKGPFSGGELETPLRAATDVGAVEKPSAVGVGSHERTTMRVQTLDIVRAPLDVRQHWHWFPFRIVKATLRLELQMEWIDVGGDRVVFLCPDLWCPDIKTPGLSEEDIETLLKKVVIVQQPSYLGRSRRLTLLHERPTVQIYQDKRRKTGAPPGALPFSTYPLMELTFWLHEPTSKAMFKVVGPLVLVATLMFMNFEEFYGFDDLFYNGECSTRQTGEGYGGYLGNMIGVALAAVLIIPSIRAEATKSPGVSVTADDWVATTFLLGLALSTVPICEVALAGCLLSSTVILGAVLAFVFYLLECSTIRRAALKDPLTKIPKLGVKDMTPDFDTNQWTNAEDLPIQEQVWR